MNKRGVIGILSILVVLGLVVFGLFMLNNLLKTVIPTLVILGILAVVGIGMYSKVITPKTVVPILVIMIIGVGAIAIFRPTLALIGEERNLTTPDPLVSSNIDMSVGVDWSLPPVFLEGGYEAETLPSITCTDTLSKLFGCRLGRGTYRPVKVVIENKDPILPLPKSLLLLRINPETRLVENEELQLTDIGVGLSAASAALVADKENVGFRIGELKDSKNYAYVIMVVPALCKTCPDGTKWDSSEVKQPVYLLITEEAKTGYTGVVEASLMERVTSDTITDYAIWGASIDAEGNVGFWEGAWNTGLQAIAKALNEARGALSILGIEPTRTVYHVKAWSFRVGSPDVEILLTLGGLGVFLMVAFLFRQPIMSVVGRVIPLG